MVTAPSLSTLALSPKQIESCIHSDARVNLWHGAIRSGKTIASLLRWLRYVATAPSGGELVMIGRTRDSIARNVFGPLQDPALFGGLALLVHYTPGAPTAMILGRRVHVLGASDSRSEMVLRGLTCSGAYVDEATLLTEGFWTTLRGRMSVPGAQLFATTNPDGPSHWFKRQVLDRAAELGFRTWKFLLEDNAWLMANNPGYVEQIKREYVGLWYRRYIEGEWVQAEGAVYDMWDPARHVVTRAQVPELERVLSLGVDYGTTNPTRGLLVGLAERNLWVLDEWAPGSMTVAEHSAQLRTWLGGRDPEPWQRPEWIYVDPSAAAFKMQLFHDGMTNVAGAHNDVLAGIRTVGSLLATDRLKVVGDNCPQLVEQIPGYSWDPKATGKGEDKPIKVDDHEVDALRYGIHSTRALWRGSIPTATAQDTAPGADAPDDHTREAA